MKTAAVIAEYNPFHAGHQYHIAQTRRQTGADFILAVMSGDFVQRGEPAICNKYDRTRMALVNGVDVVLELPVRYALSSSADFAEGGTRLCEQLGCVDILSFGSESGHLALLENIASLELKAEQDPGYQEMIRTALKAGSSYPSARANALCTWSSYVSFPAKAELTDLLLQPNNILALEYCKALLQHGSQIRPFTVRRKGNYHAPDSDPAHSQNTDGYLSAAAIRQILLSSDGRALSTSDQWADQLPEYTLFASLSGEKLLSAEDFSALLHYKLLSRHSSGFSEYLDCSEDLSDKILKFLPAYHGFSDFCSKLKSRDLTYSRISRVLMHILLEIMKADSSLPVSVPYARLLGFRKDAQPVLAQIKKCSSVPLLSKMADAANQLDPSGRHLLAEDILAAEIYETVRFHKTGIAPVNEYKQSPIIISS